MTYVKIYTIAFFAALFGILLTVCEIAEAQQLTREGEQRRSAHQFLFEEFTKGRDCKFTDDGKILNSIVIQEKRIEGDGEFKIQLPSGAQRIAGMFRHITLNGENLDRITDFRLLPYKPNSKLHHSQQTPTIFRKQLGAFPTPTPDLPDIELKVQTNGPVSIDSIVFSSQNRLNIEFDDLPYRNLGDEQPPVNVDLQLDLNRELSIGGIVDLRRAKFFRYYAAPGQVGPKLEQWIHERNFYPGRQIFKMQPALVKGYSPRQPKLKQSASRPGHADLSFFSQYNSSSPSQPIAPFQDIDYAMCLDNWPDFMSIPHVGRGTPKIEYFDAAAELAAAYIEDQIRDRGRTATWWEVKNESTIKSEWDYHWKPNSWDLLADFHNRVAKKIHDLSPQVKVGGPSSAWMQLDFKDFAIFKDHRKFMDNTRGNLDFYSHHFYENIGSVAAWHRRDQGYSGYLLGRLEASLDMIVAHMQATDNVRPILITECGSLQAGQAATDYWLRLRSFSAYMHKFMRRPHQIDLCVPFAFLTVPWNPSSGNAAFVPSDENESNGPLPGFRETPVVNFFNLWREFDGRRLPVKHSQRWLDATCVHQGNRIYLALTNMAGRRLNVNLRGFTNGQLASAFQRRLYLKNGDLKYEDRLPLTKLNAIEVDVEETTVIVFNLRQPLQIDSTLQREFVYAADTAVKTDRARSFEIELAQPSEIESAKLVVGVHRQGGLNGPLTGRVNGKPLKLNASWARQHDRLFAPIDVALPVKLRKEENRITIDKMPGLTVTSVHLQLDRAR